jgi:hypothetical protein
MSYLLEGLLHLRRTREERALRELAQARAQMAAAAAALAVARDELARYHAWRPLEEARQWELILGQEIRRQDLDAHKGRLQTLADGEVERGHGVQQAEKTWSATRDVCEQKRQLHVRATRNVQKLEEHKKLELAQQAKETERLLETELEDIRFHAQAEF